MSSNRHVLVAEISVASTRSFPNKSQRGFSRALAGGKGHALAELAAAGFAIPRTIVFTTRLFGAHVETAGASELFRRLERTLAAGRKPRAAELARARRVLSSAPLGRELRVVVRLALEKLARESSSRKLALRSSAVGEDRARATFAGLHDSVLAIASLDEAESALRRCWLSLLSTRAIDYRARLRSRSPLAMAVVAQEHIEASAAGVAFSRVGALESARVVVELAPPGESAPVTGAATPERFEVPRVPTAGVSKGDVRAAAKPLARWLTSAQAIDVVRQALRAEELLGAPADIEWLLAADRVVLVQARPARVAAAPRYDRTAVAESLPGALAPLARDFIVRAYARAFASHHGASEKHAARMLVYSGGRVFMDTWRLHHVLVEAARKRGRDARDARRRAKTDEQAGRSECALLYIVQTLDRPAPPLERKFRSVESELDRLLPLYLLAQDDVALVQDAIARTRAKLELPLGTPPALDAGAIELAHALARAASRLRAREWNTPEVRQLLLDFGHRGGVEWDLASPPLGEDLEALRALAGASGGRRRKAKRPEASPGFHHKALRGLLEHGRAAAARADRLRDVATRAVRAAREIATRAGALLMPGRPDDVFFLERDELLALLRRRTVKNLRAKIARRRRTFEHESARHVPLATDRPEREETVVSSDSGKSCVLRGIAASGGIARGRARVVRRPQDLAALEPAEILVAHAATADLFGALTSCAGLVTDVGGMLSHGAILARELGVPAVVATGEASARLRTGDRIEVDGERGTVEIQRRTS